jgi:hypothetical protein
MHGARPFGIIGGTATETRIAFFKKSAQDGFDWQTRYGDADATRLFRFAARCETTGCGHFAGGGCSLGHRVRTTLPAVVDALPACLIRASCRWHAEQGDDVCLRCPQVVTMIPADDGPLNRVAAAR